MVTAVVVSMLALALSPRLVAQENQLGPPEALQFPFEAVPGARRGA